MAGKEFVRKNFTAHNGVEFVLTWCKITGKGPGRTLTLIGGQHGMEHSGPNILQKFLFDINPNSFNGTIYVCPCANPKALEIDYEIYPEDHDLAPLKEYFYSLYRHDYCVFAEGRGDKRTWYNMNRLWNLDTIYGTAGKVARYLWDEIVIPADVVIDFHAAISEKPFMYFGGKYDILPLAGRLGAEGMYRENDPDTLEEYFKHTLTQQVNESGRIGFTLEFGLQHFLKESEYPVGFEGIDNIMKAMQMKAGDIVLKRPTWCIPPRKAMVAEHTGHIRFFKTNYDQISKGEKLYEIWDIQTLETLETGYSPLDGIITWKNYKPVQDAGKAACLVIDAKMICDAGIQAKLPENFFENIRATRKKEYPDKYIPKPETN